MIGIICATPEEFAALKNRFEFDLRPVRLAEYEFWKGTAYGRKIVLVQTGIGKVNAATAATIMFTTFECTDLAFSGVAGSLNSSYQPGDVVLGVRVATHDYGHMANGKLHPVKVGVLPVGAPILSNIPEMPNYVMNTLDFLRDRSVGKVNHPIHFGTILTGDWFINCDLTRDRLRALGGDAVDMESAAVVEVANRFHRACYVIRTISDSADGSSHLDYADLATMAAENSAIMLRELVQIMP